MRNNGFFLVNFIIKTNQNEKPIFPPSASSDFLCLCLFIRLNLLLLQIQVQYQKLIHPPFLLPCIRSWLLPALPVMVKVEKSLALSKVKMSEWSSYSPEKQASKAEDMCKMVTKGKMPTKGFLKDHPEATLTPEQIATICNWSADSIRKITVITLYDCGSC